MLLKKTIKTLRHHLIDCKSEKFDLTNSFNNKVDLVESLHFAIKELDKLYVSTDVNLETIKEDNYTVYIIKGWRYRIVQTSSTNFVIEKEIHDIWEPMNFSFRDLKHCIDYLSDLEKYPIYH